MTDVNEFVPARAMVVVAHPDDAEFMVAGTVSKWARRGCEVTYVVVTRGDKGSDDPEMTPDRLAKIREAEQRAAGAILGVSNFEFLGYPDAYLVASLELRRDITRVIRKHRPEVVLTFDPSTRFMDESYPNHPDHRTVGDVTIDAIFPSARDRLTFPELLAAGFEPHKVREIWLGGSEKITVRIDIGETLDLKRQALRAHPSQLGEDVLQFIDDWARGDATDEPFEFGESFRRIILDRELVPEAAAGEAV